jgi:hypothetical protein
MYKRRMANRSSAMCAVSGNTQQICAASTGVSDYNCAKKTSDFPLFFYWFVVGFPGKNSAGCGRYYAAKLASCMMTKWNKVPAIIIMLLAFLLIRRIVTLPAVPFG